MGDDPAWQDKGRVSLRLCVGRLHVDFERDSALRRAALSLPLGCPSAAIRMALKPSDSVTIRSDYQAHATRCHAVFTVLYQWVARGAMCVRMTQVMGALAGLFFAYVYQWVRLRHLDAPPASF
jgi:hypothetical protein